MSNTALVQLRGKPWIWAFLAAVFVWAATIIFTRGQGAGEILSAALAFGTFTVIVGIGQMYVITLGPGNVDLSIPATMTFAGVVSMKIIDSQNSMILTGLLIALACGVAVGIFNYGLIRLLRIPPIIATLSSSFLVQSSAIAYGRGLKIKPPSLLAEFSTAKVLGVPILALCVMFLVAVMSLVLHRTVYGKSVLAIGQNSRAAMLAGVRVDFVRFATYVLSAALAGLCGYVLSGFSGGASLNMGAEYLLASIAVVVIGGTSIAGGFSNLPGLWGASLFMFLLVTMLNTFGLSAGVRLIMTGAIIVGVIVLAGGRRHT